KAAVPAATHSNDVFGHNTAFGLLVPAMIVWNPEVDNATGASAARANFNVTNSAVYCDFLHRASARGQHAWALRGHKRAQHLLSQEILSTLNSDIASFLSSQQVIRTCFFFFFPFAWLLAVWTSSYLSCFIKLAKENKDKHGCKCSPLFCMRRTCLTVR